MLKKASYIVYDSKRRRAKTSDFVVSRICLDAHDGLEVILTATSRRIRRLMAGSMFVVDRAFSGRFLAVILPNR